jgi:DnaJ-class molecular chaperone
MEPELNHDIAETEAKQPCLECHGKGKIITCLDDICHAQNSCMHGDGEIECPECNGSGIIGNVRFSKQNVEGDPNAE